MSALGDQYQYDVFFSYSWATEETGDTELRDWCRAIADTLRKVLSIRFNGPSVQFRYYLDRDRNKSAMELQGTLQEAAQNSGIFVAMVGPYYDSEWCKNEVRWFLDKLTKSGVSNAAERICILRVGAGYWPESLTDSTGHPLLYIDLCDASGQPTNLTSFVLNRTLPDLTKPINDAALEIADKLDSLKKKLRASEEYRKSKEMLDQPLLFLEAETQDYTRWNECSNMLRAVPSIVMPVQSPKPATAAASTDLNGCDGLVLLRTRQGDEIGQRIKSAYLYRRQMYREKELTLPWVLLDDLDDPPPESDAFNLPRIRLEGDWVGAFLKTWKGTR